MEENKVEFPKSLIASLLLVVFLALLVFFIGSSESIKQVKLPSPDVLISVNGAPITLEMYQRALGVERVGMVLNGMDPSLVDIGGLIDMLIVNRLVMTSAERAGVSVPAEEVQGQIDSIIMGLGMSAEELDGLLVSQGSSLAQLGDYIEESLVGEKYLIEVMLAEYPQEEWGARFDEWLTTAQNNAVIDINEELLIQVTSAP